VADRVDHRHDHEAERNRDADVPQCLGLGIDHDRAGARKDERERSDHFCDQLPRQRAIDQQQPALVAG
jgi:hypothetical protein